MHSQMIEHRTHRRQHAATARDRRVDVFAFAAFPCLAYPNGLLS
jgi:hypothetical protein